jgi:hypothetical protein
MRRIRSLLLILATGCTTTEPMNGVDTPGLKAADERQLELQRNLNEGRSWQEQERLMSDVKNAFGSPSKADATGPGR